MIEHWQWPPDAKHYVQGGRWRCILTNQGSIYIERKDRYQQRYWAAPTLEEAYEVIGMLMSSQSEIPREKL